MNRKNVTTDMLE